MTGISLALGVSLALGLPLACLITGLKAAEPADEPALVGRLDAGASDARRVQKRFVELLRSRQLKARN